MRLIQKRLELQQERIDVDRAILQAEKENWETEKIELVQNRNGLALKSLPPEMKEKFKEAQDDIKSIDDLSKVLNHLFSTYGDTLKHGYMIIDQGGQRSVWLRMSKKTFDATLLVGNACVDAEVTMDQLLGNVVQLIAEGKAPEVLKMALKRAPHHKMPPGLANLPTEDNLEQIESLSDGE